MLKTNRCVILSEIKYKNEHAGKQFSRIKIFFFIPNYKTKRVESINSCKQVKILSLFLLIIPKV